MLSLLVHFLFYIALSTAAPTDLRELVPVPDDDSFYNPLPGYESEPPGAVLRQRRIATSFFGFIPAPVEAYQLLYRTVTANGSATATVTTIFKPLFAKRDRFVSFQTAYDSAASFCNPSYNYRLGAPPKALVSSLEFIILQAYLLQGYIVSSPDYEGRDAAFAAARLAGTGTLDSMRAVTNFGTKLGLSTRQPLIVGVGYSGGAIATGWAATLHPTYAPELSVRGWVGGGTPANLSASFAVFDGAIGAGLIPVAIAGLLKPSAYGAELRPLFERVATPAGKEVIQKAQEQCTPLVLLDFVGESLLTTKYQTLGPGLLQDPSVSAIVDTFVMGTNADKPPVAPVLLYHAVQDQVVPFAPADLLSKNWCSQGASVKLLAFAGGGHLTTEILGLPSALDFTRRAFSGTITEGCSTDTVLEETLDPIALGANLELLVFKLLGILIKAGTRDESILKDFNVLLGAP